MKKFIMLVIFFSCFTNIYADNFEQSTNNYFNKIKNNPKKLYLFLLKMPKGGDLHYHLDGGSYAENLFSYALKSKKCINISSRKVANCTSKSYIHPYDIRKNSKQYHEIISDWSVIGNNTIQNNARFYQYFPNTFPIRENNRGEMLAEIIKRASQQNIMYLELMLNPDEDQIRAFGAKQKESISNFNEFTDALFSNGIEKYVKSLSLYIDSIGQVKNNILYCKTYNIKSSECGIKVKYLYQINRDVSLKEFFSSALEGFLISRKDKNFVGISLVGNESGNFATKNYKEEMKIIDFLHRKYPAVKITLHAGELSKQLFLDVPYIKSHVRNAVDLGDPNRIGHGTDIKYEKNYQDTLKKIRHDNIAVETCLTSNQRLLGVSGRESAILIYYHNGIPITLCTDDEGILRTNLTHQFEITVETYHFSYAELKNIVRNSIYYSFLPGKNLWKSSSYKSIKKTCSSDFSKKQLETTRCKNYLSKNEKARMEWNLEMRFYQFEHAIKNT